MSVVDARPRAAVLRGLVRGHATRVVVITAGDEGGGGSRRPSGFCATSLAVVSLTPAQVSFAVRRDSRSGEVWRTAGSGVVHLLAEHHRPLATRFADAGRDRFAGLDWSWSPAGAPLLADVDDRLEVTTLTRVELATHLLVVAEVDDGYLTDSSPLLHHGGQFARRAPLDR